MAHTAIQTDKAPAAIGPYSQAIQSGDFLFCSGQIPLSPTTGELVGSDIRAQCEQVMKNIQAVLAAASLEWGNIVKSTIFVTDLGDFGAVNEVYGSYFKDLTPPARSTVQVSALPKGAKVEIEVVARK